MPLVVDEPGSATALRIWTDAERVVTVRLAYAEGRAALAQARRIGRLTEAQSQAAVEAFERCFAAVDVAEVDDRLARRAGEIAVAHALRGYDAVHVAAAERFSDPDLVVVAGDGALLRAASVVGMAVAALG